MTAADRLLVLAPHPDDEVVGAGGMMARARELGVPVKVAYLTNGDFNEWSFIAYRIIPPITPSEVRGMGRVREGEALSAIAALGLPQTDAIFLGYPDGGTMPIWLAHWNNAQPVRGRLTNSRSVPYVGALRPGAPYLGDDVLQDLSTVISQFRPTIIAVSHPADFHPDHRALFLFTTIALWDLHMQNSVRVLPYLVHHGHWPEPDDFNSAETLRPPAELSEYSWRQFPLSATERQIKLHALEQHRTQMRLGKAFLERFIRSNELFGAVSATRIPVDSVLTLEINVSGKLEADLGFSVYVFGWRADRDFTRMPKLQLRVTARGWTLRDQAVPVKTTLVNIRRRGDRFEIQLPLSLLGNPQRILMGGHGISGLRHSYDEAWQILMLQQRTP